MFYREAQQDPYFDVENPSEMDSQQVAGAICPYAGTECPFRQDEEQEFDPTQVRQRPRRRRIRRPYYYNRPYQYPYYPIYYPIYYPPYYPWFYDEYYNY